MIKYRIQTSPHDVITSQEVVGVLGVEEEEGEGEEGGGWLSWDPSLFSRRDKGCSHMILVFSRILLVVGTLWRFCCHKIFRSMILTFFVQIGSQMLDWVEAKYEVTKVSKLQGSVK